MNEKVESPDMIEQKKRDRIALIVSILFVLTIGFLGYRFFNKSDNVKTALYNVTQSNERAENAEGDIMAAQTKRDEETAENGVSAAETDSAMENKADTNSEATAVAGTSTENTSPSWHANDYKSGDIKAGSTYTVQSGDTLWEIAEAAYGNGANWVQILNANGGDIGFLANGQQSLIVTGQTLVIPSIS